MNWCQFLPCWGQFLGYKEGGNQYWQDNCEENADFSDLNVMAISGGGWQVVCLQNICWAERIFSKAPTFWAFDRIGKLYLVSFWVMKSFVVLCERTCLWGSWFPFFFFIFCLMFTFPFGHLAVRQGTFFSGSQILLSCFPVHAYSVHLDASHWNLEFFGFTQTTFFVHPKNSRFQCSASRFTEYFVHRKKTQKDLLTRKKIPCLTAKCPSGKVYIKKRKKNGKQLPRRRVLTHAPRKAFHCPEREMNRPLGR